MVAGSSRTCHLSATRLARALRNLPARLQSRRHRPARAHVEIAVRPAVEPATDAFGQRVVDRVGAQQLLRRLDLVEIDGAALDRFDQNLGQCADVHLEPSLQRLPRGQARSHPAVLFTRHRTEGGCPGHYAATFSPSFINRPPSTPDSEVRPDSNTQGESRREPRAITMTETREASECLTCTGNCRTLLPGVPKEVTMPWTFRRDQSPRRRGRNLTGRVLRQELLDRDPSLRPGGTPGF